jgi:hypothetical protein
MASTPWDGLVLKRLCFAINGILGRDPNSQRVIWPYPAHSLTLHGAHNAVALPKPHYLFPSTNPFPFNPFPLQPISLQPISVVSGSINTQPIFDQAISPSNFSVTLIHPHLHTYTYIFDDRFTIVCFGIACFWHRVLHKSDSHQSVCSLLTRSSVLSLTPVPQLHLTPWPILRPPRTARCWDPTLTSRLPCRHLPLNSRAQCRHPPLDSRAPQCSQHSQQMPPPSFHPALPTTQAAPAACCVSARR